MDKIKTSLKSLEQSVVQLEQAVYASQKLRNASAEKITDLKTVVRTAYDRLDKALAAYKQGDQ